MAVAGQTLVFDIEAEIERILMRFKRINSAVSNLKKKGRANYTAELLNEKLTFIKTYWDDAFNRYDALCVNIPASKRQEHAFFKEQQFENEEEQFLEAQSYLVSEISKLTIAKAGDAKGVPSFREEMSTDTLPIPLELPRQSLPKFGGELRKWFHFEDVFTSTIISNKRLSDVQRLQYLNACVEGEPLAMIESLDIVEQNFDVAWQILKARYGKRQLVIENLLDTVYELKPIRRGDLASIKQVTIYLRQTLNALGKLDRPVETYGDLLNAYIKRQFDDELKREWRKIVMKAKEYPSFEDMLKFLEEYEDTHLQPSAIPRKTQATTQPSNTKVRAHNAVPVVNVVQNKGCGFCSFPHDVTQCQNFMSMTPEQRYNCIKGSMRCVLCLNDGHAAKRCPSPTICKKCKGRHHTMLHFNNSNPGAGKRKPEKRAAVNKSDDPRDRAPPRSSTGYADGSATSSAALTSHAGAIAANVGRPVILATALVRIFGEKGTSRIARALLDQGSESSFISASLANDLQLSRRKTPAEVSGLGGGQTQRISHSVNLTLGSTKSASPVYTASAYVIPRITSYTPPSIRTLDYGQLRELTLADPDPASTHRVEVLIGADLYARIIRRGIRRTSPNGPIAQATAFGWVISGPMNTDNSATHNVSSLHCNTLEALDKTIRRFWEMAEVPSKQLHTKAEGECEAHFTKTVSRDETGRFIVRLPFNQQRPEEMLGESLHIALSALARLRKKLDVNPPLVREYGEFLTEYESLAHMTRLESVEKRRLYIPHRAVIREESATTKLRVVFNASSGTASGRSLNDILHVGPKLQTDITSVLTRWRLYEYVLVADIEKMFRQILVAPEDRRFQCIVWREPKTEQLTAFELNTVTYGTACAPYLSMRTLLELRRQDGDGFPLAAPILERDIYVDDVFMGAPDKPLLEQIRTQVCGLLQRGGFHLRKWAGNSTDLLRNIPQSAHSHAVDLTLFDDSELKVLGLRWIPSGDYFYFDLQRFKPSALPITKRTLFSEIAKLYDPLGWLSPIVIRAKILMQSQWLEKIHWDDHVSANTHKTWNSFCADWSRLNELKIPRWIRFSADTASVELHGFCDASLAAYSAVTYLRVTTVTNEVFSTLLMAKTRVAPIKTVSIPILELNGAVLLTELLQHVKSSLSIRVERVVCWSDSTITLAWLRKHPSTWKVAVANRVSKIQTLLPNAEWRYVPTRVNPADLNSRGLEAAEYLQSELWMSGPTWLRQTEAKWPLMPASVETEEGKRIAHVHAAIPREEWKFLFRFHSWGKLLRVTAYCLRLRGRRCKERRSFVKDIVEPSELQLATKRIARYIQGTYFAEEYQCLNDHREIPTKSPLKNLNPFLDADGVLRVGGRLENAVIPWETKHPIILPKHYVSTLIIRQCHVNTLHGGLQSTMHTVRQFWILGCRSTARAVINRCVKCIRWQGKTSTQIMQDLITERCRPARAFSNCGVDYAGPFRVRNSAGRGKTAHKAYIAVFVCYATRAIHIELVHDYSTSSFLAALDRFTARRGIPSCIFSDNGTNFVGADRELQARFREAASSKEVQNNNQNGRRCGCGYLLEYLPGEKQPGPELFPLAITKGDFDTVPLRKKLKRQ